MSNANVTGGGARVALYARNSSEKQEKAKTIDAQIEALRQYASDHQAVVVGEFVDEGISGRSVKGRAGLAELMAQAALKPRRFDTVLVWAFDRFGRNFYESVVNKHELGKLGVKVKSITQHYGDGDGAEMAEHFQEIIDEQFSRTLRKNVLRGLRHTAGQGFRVNRAPVGYRVTRVEVNGHSKARLEVDAEYAPIVQLVFELAAAGHGTNEICNLINREGYRTPGGGRWSRALVLKILNNEVYTGACVWGRRKKVNGRMVKSEDEEVVRVEGAHPALVDRETFERVRGLLQERSFKYSHPRTVGSRYLLSGLLRCACGHAMTGTGSSRNRYQYYGCAGKNEKLSDCAAHQIRQYELEAAVLDQITRVLLHLGAISDLVALVNDDLMDNTDGQLKDRLEARLADARRRLEKLYDAVELGAVELSDLSPRIKKLKAEISELEAQYYGMVGAVAARPEPIDINAVQDYVAGLSHLLSMAEPAQAKSILRSFVREIRVDLPSVTIEYTLPLPSPGESKGKEKRKGNGGSGAGGGITCIETNGLP